MMNKRGMCGALIAAAVMMNAWGVSEVAAQEGQGNADASRMQVEGMGNADEQTKQLFPAPPMTQEKPLEEEPPVELGFGCPFNEYECHAHCLSIGMRGGYCSGFFRQTCVCYR